MPPLLLVLDFTAAPSRAALWRDGAILAAESQDGPTGQAALLPRLVADLAASQDLPLAAISGIAVAVGPGSFTGIRASLAFAHGLSAGLAVPLLPVTLAEALTVGLHENHVPIWCAIQAGGERIFLFRPETEPAWLAVTPQQLPPTPPTLRLVGDGAEALAPPLRAQGAVVTVLAAARPGLSAIALAAEARREGRLPALAPLPLYIDPPRALPPKGGLRPAPLPVAPP